MVHFMKKSLFRTKPVPDLYEHYGLKLRACLTAVDLTFLGVGAIIGAGIFVLTGFAAATQAGPAIVFSYVVAGLACAFAALSYAELAATVGGCGSAYGYAYASMGELLAWIIGWDLILEYAVSVSAVSVGWSGYAQNMLTGIGLQIPEYLSKSPFDGGWLNLPALLIVLSISALLIIGVKSTARFNKIMVLTKLTVIGIFIFIATKHVNPANWHPFMPFGFHGIMSGAALVFFAYIGFDAVSTTAEEVINPERDMPIGIITSLAICTVLYIVVSGLLTGIVPYPSLNVSSPISQALLSLGYRTAASLVAVGAIAGLTTVILVMYYGLTRVFLAMSRDGLLPTVFSQVNPTTRTPIRIIIWSGLLMACFSAFIPIHELAEMVNIGTLAAFVIVCVGVIVLRYRQPNLHRPFKTPLMPLIPLLGVGFCLYLIMHLNPVTWLRFLVWLIVGIIIYFTYSRYHSRLNRP
jgi:APA family basic amino acid/polyamine antiporter